MYMVCHHLKILPTRKRYTQKPDPTCTPDSTKMKAHRQVVGVENAERKSFGKATGLYNKHHKYSDQWNPWHPFQSAHDFQQAQSFSHQMKWWIDQHLRHGLDNFKIKSFQSADAMQKLLSQLDFRLGDDSWIEYHSHIIGTLYYRDISKCIQFLWAHLPYRVHLDFEPVRLAHSASRRIYSQMNTGDSWCYMQDQHSAGVTIVPLNCASDKTHLNYFPGEQHAWLRYLKICNIRKDIHRPPKKCSWILVLLIPCPTKGAKNTDDAWHSAVETVPSPLQNLDVTRPGVKCNCAGGFHRQCYPHLAAWVGDYQEQVMVAEVTYGCCPICEIPKGAPMRHSTFWQLDDSRDQDVHFELLHKPNIHVLQTLGVHPMRN